MIKPGKNKIQAVDAPEPAVGPDEIKIRLEAASLNYRDILMLQFADQEIVPFSDGA